MTPAKPVTLDGRPAVARCIGRWVLWQTVGEPSVLARLEAPDPRDAQARWLALASSMTRASLAQAGFEVLEVLS